MKSEEGFIKKCNWKVYKGNCIDLLNDMNEEVIDCIVTSPPYFNKRSYGAKPKNDGNIAKWQYAKSSGVPILGEIGNTKNKDEYMNDMKNVMALCFKVLKENKFLFINISTYHNKHELFDFSYDFINIAKSIGFIHWDSIIWIKPNRMPAGKYKKIYLARGWEYILVFCKGKKYEINEKITSNTAYFKCKNCGLENYLNNGVMANYVFSNTGCIGRKRKPLIKHPAVFPFEIPSYCLSIAAKPGELILDPFVGSGTTLIAGISQGLNVIGCELIPKFYDDLVIEMKKLSK